MFIKPIRWLLEMAGVADILNTYMPDIGNYLDTGWGTLTSVAVGALIIGSAIFFHERRAGNNTEPSTPKDQQAFIGRESEKLDSQRVALTRAMLEFHTIAFLACGKTPAGNINSGPELQMLRLLKDAATDGRLKAINKNPSGEFYMLSKTTSHDLLEFCERHPKLENLLRFARQWAKEVQPRHYVLNAEPGEYKVTGANVEN